MKLFVRTEMIKRDESKAFSGEARKLWVTKKEEIEDVFHCIFKDFKAGGQELHIDNNLNDEFSEKKYIGYDCVQVSFPARFTGNRVITKGNDTTKMDVKKEIGASLSITTSAIGSFDVFLIPAKNDDKLIDSKSLIVYSCKDPIKLTRERIYKSIRQFLIFQRVDSIMESSSLCERIYIWWLYFWDARNREKYSSLLFQITNHWSAVAVSALAAWVIAKNTGGG